MNSKKINQLATELTPSLSDITIIGDPSTGISKKITLSQMASLFTGTVEEYANLAAFPLVGTADTIYIALDTNILYRWDTSLTSYVELSPNIVTSLVFSDANGFDGTISLVGSTATLTITTALTTGSVPFIGASGALSQDNANLFFDDTNNRLGINTNIPTTALDVFGSGIIGRLNGTSTNNAYLGFASAGTNQWSIGNVQSDQRFRIYSEANTAELVSVLQTGEFGIGIANPTTKLHIDGGASALIANLDANVSVAKSISFRSDNSARINLEVSGTESGSNAGADLFIRRYSDAGALIDTPLTITRSTGAITLATALTVPNGGTGATSFSSNVILKGAGTSAITTSLLTDTGTNLTYTGEEIVINKTGGAFLSLLSADTDTQYIQFKDTGGASGSIRYNHTNNSMIFKGNGSDILTLASTGSVKIGTGGTEDANGLHIRKTGNHLLLQNTNNSNYWNFDINSNNLLYIINNNNIGLLIDNSGIVMIGTSNTNPAENNVKGVSWFQDGRQFISSDNNEVMRINRKTSDGVLVFFHQDGVAEGNISVSGTTVSYNGGHLSRYSQTETYQRIEGLLKGTVMSNLDKMAQWINPETSKPYENEQLNCMKISDVEGDVNVAGVFVNWDDDDKSFTNDFNIAMTGDMIIRISKDVIVEKGQLLMSAGDGTAKPQGDDIIRAKTIAKVTSNHISCTYEDGSYCVPCVLMAC